jgi:hypothetical protein
MVTELRASVFAVRNQADDSDQLVAPPCHDSPSWLPRNDVLYKETKMLLRIRMRHAAEANQSASNSSPT